MAAGDFSAAADYDPILIALNELWDTENVIEDTQAPLVTMNEVITNHGMRSIPVRDGRGKCVTTRVWWTQDGDYDPAYNSTTFDATVGCEAPDGVEDEAYSADFDPNIFIYQPVAFSDQDCSNRLFGINRTAQRINDAIRAVRKGLAEQCADLLTGNAQANGYTAGPGTIAGTVTQFTPTEFGDLTLLTTLRLIGLKNQIPNYRVLNGTNFWEVYQNAVMSNSPVETDIRDTNIARPFGMSWDIWLDDYLATNPTTFLFDPRRIGFGNYPRFMNDQPMPLHGTADYSVTIDPTAGTDQTDSGTASVAQHFGWGVNDPVFRYLATDPDTGATSLQPVRYDVEYKKVCSGRDAMGYLKYTHHITVYFNGALHVSPTALGGAGTKSTGILEFQAVA